MSINKLRQSMLKDASQKYYSTGTSPLTDAEFDKLLEEERNENPNSPLLQVGHGYDINKDPRAKQKVPHKYGIVGSLDKVRCYSDLPKSFKPDITCLASLKLDGISSVMYYEKGIMQQALTRGQIVNNIPMGIDITEKVKTITPNYIEIPDKFFTGAVRGEILMPYANFEEYRQLHPDASNARNSAAGLMGQLEISDELKYLKLVPYTIIGHELEGTMIDIIHERITGKDASISSMYNIQLMWLANNFGKENIVPFEKFHFNEYDFMDHMEAFRSKWYGIYPADGIVLTDMQIAAKGNSRIFNSVAFKFKSEIKETYITGIEWNLSKTKYLVPTVLVEPIQLSGATISRCAGCNAKIVKDNGWGIGAKIKLLRSGEVIPKIEETLIKGEVALPFSCPSCGADLIWEGVHLKCPNPNCGDIKLQDLLVWCNNISPIDGLGDTLKIKFFEELRDNYNFDISIEGIYNFGIALPQTDSVQKQLFYQMLNNCMLSKVPITSALKALNIPRLGDAAAEKLSQYPEDIDKLIAGIVPDNFGSKVGEANAKSFIKHIAKFTRLIFIKKNLIFNDKFQNNDRIKVAITGSLSIPRKQFEQLLNDNGFVLGDITKDTKYLITSDPNSGSSKNVKADKLGIEKVTEEQFRVKFNLT